MLYLKGCSQIILLVTMSYPLVVFLGYTRGKMAWILMLLCNSCWKGSNLITTSYRLISRSKFIIIVGHWSEMPLDIWQLTEQIHYSDRMLAVFCSCRGKYTILPISVHQRSPQKTKKIPVFKFMSAIQQTLTKIFLNFISTSLLLGSPHSNVFVTEWDSEDTKDSSLRL